MILFDYKFKFQRLLTHIMFWVTYVSAFAFLISVNSRLEFLNVALKTFYFLPLDIIATYVTLYFLIPQFLIKRKYGSFISLFIILAFLGVLGYQTIAYFIYLPIYFPEALERFSFFQFDIWYYLISNMSVVVVAASIKLIKLWTYERQAKSELETQKIKSELMLLKSQINPHFIFNTLNNIDSLIISNPEKASESIIKLSEILRYVTYDINADYVSIDQEINYLKSYLELNRLRFGHDFIDFNIEFHENHKLIAPMLFIPLVENALKHGYKNCSLPGVSIRLIISKEITFEVINYISPTISNETRKSEGIGIPNLIKRLEYLYPNAYELTFNKTHNQYIAKLCLK